MHLCIMSKQQNVQNCAEPSSRKPFPWSRSHIACMFSLLESSLSAFFLQTRLQCLSLFKLHVSRTSSNIPWRMLVWPPLPTFPLPPFTWMQDPFPFSLFFEMGFIVHDRSYCKLLRTFLLLFKPPYPWFSNWSPKTKNASEQQTLHSCVLCSRRLVFAGRWLRFSVCGFCVLWLWIALVF